MKEKSSLIIGIIVSIGSIITLFSYRKMEINMPEFHAQDNYSWICLIFGIALIAYSIGRNEKDK